MKRRERPENTTISTLICWGLKNGRDVVPPFSAPKFQFSKSVKPPIVKHFQEKLDVRKRANMIIVLGVFEFDAFSSFLFGFCKKGGVGGRKPPPKG